MAVGSLGAGDPGRGHHGQIGQARHGMMHSQGPPAGNDRGNLVVSPHRDSASLWSRVFRGSSSRRAPGPSWPRLRRRRCCGVEHLEGGGRLTPLRGPRGAPDATGRPTPSRVEGASMLRCPLPVRGRSRPEGVARCGLTLHRSRCDAVVGQAVARVARPPPHSTARQQGRTNPRNLWGNPWHIMHGGGEPAGCWRRFCSLAP